MAWLVCDGCAKFVYHIVVMAFLHINYGKIFFAEANLRQTKKCAIRMYSGDQFFLFFLSSAN